MISISKSNLVSTRRALAVAAAICALAGAPALASGDEAAAVQTANAGFYSALNKMFTGDSSAMVAVWSHRDDVTYMGPNGQFETGWSAVLKVWESQAAMKLGGKVEPADVQTIVGQDIAVLNDFEEGENTNAKGKVEHLKLRATNIFRKEDGQWKMVGHHTDTLPYLAK